jgi:hypothetical protein
MKTFILILFFHVGFWGDTDSNATTSVPGFSSMEECQRAGVATLSMVKGTKKEAKFVCVEQTTSN